MTDARKDQSQVDSDIDKGAVESDRPEAGGSQSADTSLSGQLGHRDPDPLLKDSDSDFPEPDAPGEHSGE